MTSDNAPRGWFADIDESATTEHKWAPHLQVGWGTLALDVWFATEADCEQFIREEVIGAGWLPGDDESASC